MAQVPLVSFVRYVPSLANKYGSVQSPLYVHLPGKVRGFIGAPTSIAAP
jgi:hypothetical protein